MVQVEESILAELIKKAHKFEWLNEWEWLNELDVEDLFDENGVAAEKSDYNEYYKYDDMSDEKVIEDYL